MKDSLLFIIQARTGSVRLRNKIFKKVQGLSLLYLLLLRIKKSKYSKNIVIATSSLKRDDKIKKFCIKNKISCFRGPEENVLKRIKLTSNLYNFRDIVYLTADNVLIDYRIIDYVIYYYLKNKFDFVTNNGFYNSNLRTIPYGMDVSVFSKKSFLKMYNLAKKSKEMREHPTMFYYTKGKKYFKIKNVIMPKKWHNKINVRLTLDTLKDFKLVKIVFFNFLKKKKYNFSLSDIYFFLKKKNKVLKLNQDIKQFIPNSILYNEK
jgi:spore coat polysaccharide biosynthesis protein SpsF